MRQNNPMLSREIDPELLEQALDLLRPAQRILLLAHERPDGDCLGSALGMAHILRKLGKDCVPACADVPPASFHFLPGIETIVQDTGSEAFDLVIALDAGELYRYGSLYEQRRDFLDQATILNIDHHISKGGCGKVNIIDTSAAATAEIIVLLQQQAALPLSQDGALCLLTGLMTDTGSFQYTNTTPRCLEVAAELVRHGAITETIAQPLFRDRSLAQARFQGAIIEQARTSCDGQLIWSWATAETLEQAGATLEMDGNNSGMLRDIEGVKIAAFFKSYKTPGETRLSLRAVAPHNAAEICQQLSNGLGGGHARAAGATFHKSLQETMAFVVAELEKELRGERL